MYLNKIILLSILFTACKPASELQTNQYYDIKSLFLSQINELEKEKPLFTKNIEINSEKENKELSKIQWKKELDPFVQADINKIAYAQSYTKLENDTLIKYELKPNEKISIKAILINKGKNNKQIESISVESSDENMLYYWKKTLKSTFENGKLKSYSILGKQKILIFDEEIFLVNGIRK